MDVIVATCVHGDLSLRFPIVSNAVELDRERNTCHFIGNVYTLSQQAADALQTKMEEEEEAKHKGVVVKKTQDCARIHCVKRMDSGRNARGGTE